MMATYLFLAPNSRFQFILVSSYLDISIIRQQFIGHDDVDVSMTLFYQSTFTHCSYVFIWDLINLKSTDPIQGLNNFQHDRKIREQ